MHYGKNSDNLGGSKKALQCNPATSKHESRAVAGVADERWVYGGGGIQTSKVGKAPQPSSMKDEWNRFGGLKERTFLVMSYFFLTYRSGQTAHKKVRVDRRSTLKHPVSQIGPCRMYGSHVGTTCRYLETTPKSSNLWYAWLLPGRFVHAMRRCRYVQSDQRGLDRQIRCRLHADDQCEVTHPMRSRHQHYGREEVLIGPQTPVNLVGVLLLQQ